MVKLLQGTVLKIIFLKISNLEEAKGLELTEELKKGLGNKMWRLENLYRIKDKRGQLVRFVPNAAQMDFIKNRENRNIILKSRQLGFTTFETVDMLDDVLFTRNFDAMLLSYDKTSAEDIFDNKIILAWEHYPEELRRLYQLDTETKRKLKFGFGDGVYSSISVRSRARGGTYQRVHISELSKICAESQLKEREVMSGTIPTVPIDGKIDIESTAEGEQGSFHDMFWDSWERENRIDRSPMEFKAHFYNWRWEKGEIERSIVLDVPKDFRDIQMKHGLSNQEISYYYQVFLTLNKKWDVLFQQYPTTPEEAFTYSGTKHFDQSMVDTMKLDIRDGEIVGGWTFYNPYKASHTYVLGADVAEGVGQDSSTIVILDLSTKPRAKVVATFKSNDIGPDVFAHEIKRGGRLYGDCMVAPERNNHGHATIAILKGIYDNIYQVVEKDKTLDRTTDKLGWQTNGLTKPRMMYELKDAIDEGLIEVPDRGLWKEIATYDRTDISQIRFSEERTKHWDMLIALAIAWQIRNEVYTGGKVEEEPLIFDKFAVI